MAKKRSSKSRWWLWLLVLVVAALAGGWVAYGTQLSRTGETATAYMARVGCSCRFVAGRSLADCAKDKLDGMGMVSLSDDASSRSVTATIPFIASDTASLRDGYGCVLKKWED